jgi:hypothetical protein
LESHVALPEERELSQKTQELHRLETELAERELTLATLQAQVRDFEQDYLRRVGRLYAALDEVTAELAALELREHPGSVEFERAAHDTRARAERSAREAAAAPGEREMPPFKAPPELTRLYRTLAKLVHPDLGTDPADRARRTKFMTEVNLAFQAGDEARLQALLNEWQASPEAVEGKDLGSQLVRTIRKIAQVQRRLAEIDEAIKALESSETDQLRQRAQQLVAAGRDLLVEMASEAEQRLAEARQILSRRRGEIGGGT